ncbi:MAG: hypothetical protein O7G84_13650 [Gammaproteobacteria bacterium]|nr:hypothetical protein [Gammaproteobacteria bacterium]
MRLITIIFFLPGCFAGASLAPADEGVDRLTQSGENGERDIVIFADRPALNSRTTTQGDGDGDDPMDGFSGSMAGAFAREGGDGDGDGSGGSIGDGDGDQDTCAELRACCDTLVCGAAGDTGDQEACATYLDKFCAPDDGCPGPLTCGDPAIGMWACVDADSLLPDCTVDGDECSAYPGTACSDTSRGLGCLLGCTPL